MAAGPAGDLHPHLVEAFAGINVSALRRAGRHRRFGSASGPVRDFGHALCGVLLVVLGLKPGSTETYAHPVMSSQVSGPLPTAGCRTKKMHGSSGVTTP